MFSFIKKDQVGRGRNLSRNCSSAPGAEDDSEPHLAPPHIWTRCLSKESALFAGPGCCCGFCSKSMKEKNREGEGSGRPRGSRKNIIGRYVALGQTWTACFCVRTLLSLRPSRAAASSFNKAVVVWRSSLCSTPRGESSNDAAV